VDEAVWHPLATPTLTDSTQTTRSRLARVQRALSRALVALLTTTFVGGGLFTAALALVALSRRPTEIALMVPAPVHEALGTVTSAAVAVRSPSLMFAVLPDWQGTEPFSILLLGIDQRDDARESGSDPGRTDTMMILRIDPQAKTAGLVGLPRDLWVDIPGFGKGRINTAYTYGELNAGRVDGGGPGLAARTVEAKLGLHVDHYALVNLHGFEQLIDTLGGIVIDVPRPLKDNEYPFGDYGVQRLYIPAGLQFMDGATALQYARSRHSDSDFGRMGRQQEVLFAARQRVLQLNMLPRAPALLGQARTMVSTDLGLDPLVRLAKLAQQIDSGRIQHLVIGPPLVWEANARAGEYELLWDQPRVQQTLRAFFAGLPPDRAAARIEVLNGSGRPGLAADTAKYLLNLGYEIVRIDDAARSDYPEAVLEVAPDRRGLAEDLAASLRLPRWTARTAQPGDGDTDVRLIVSREFQIPQAEAPIAPDQAGRSERLAPPLPPRAY